LGREVKKDQESRKILGVCSFEQYFATPIETILMRITTELLFNKNIR
jgi:hypothetical protein